MRLRGLKTSLVVAAVVGGLGTASCSTPTPTSTSQSASQASSQSSPSGSPLTIAYVTSLTGVAGPQFAGSQAGFLARIDLQNSIGGVNGHKLVPEVLDDQSNPSTIASAVQLAVSKGVIGIVTDSALFFLAAKYPNQAGVPVTGSFADGPEWGEQPYTNMFSSDHGSVDPKYPVNTLIGSFIRRHGGTVIGTYGYSVSPISTSSTIGNARSFQLAGGKVGVVDTSVPFGSSDFTSTALVGKERGVDAIFPSLQNSSNYALALAFQQAGVKLKVALFATGYEPDVINSPSWPALQGSYFFSIFRPFSLPNSGTQQMGAAMQKYAGLSKGQFPSYGEYESWVGADLMINGLEGAGPHPTHASLVKSLRGLTAYDANGLLSTTIDYSTIFGHDTPDCVWVLQVHPKGFVPISSKPVCGYDVPGTSS